MKLINLLCPEDLKIKFLACHILDFFKNHVFPSGWFPSSNYPHPARFLFGTVNSSSPQGNKPRDRWVCKCQIIICLMCSFCQLPPSTLILHVFVIANDFRCFFSWFQEYINLHESFNADAKALFIEQQWCYLNPIARGGDKRAPIFTKGIRPKVNIIARIHGVI